MTSTQAKFVGWSLSLDESNDKDSSGSRRSRRGASADSSLILKRDVDGLELKTGTVVLCNDVEGGGAPIAVIIKDAQFGNDDYIVVTAINLLRLDEVVNPPKDTNSQELFLTGIADKVYLHDIIEEARVLNSQDFKKIVIDDSTKGTTFLCRRGYDSWYKTYTKDIDFKAFVKKLQEDPSGELENVRHLITPPLYKEKKVALLPRKRKEQPIKKEPLKPRPKREPIVPQKKTTIPSKRGSKLKEHIVSSDEDSDEVIDIDGSDNDGDLVFDDEDEDEFAPSRTRGRPAKKQKVKGPKSLTQEKQSLFVPLSDLNDDAQDSAASLPCREEQFTQLYYSLESAIELDTGTCFYVSGPPGTGKTVTIREVARQLYRQSKSKTLNEFQYLEINGMKLLSPQSAYEVLWNKVSPHEKIPTSGLASALEKHFESGKSKIPLVVLLDELDQIASKNQSILYNFFNWPTYAKSKLIVIAVANTMDLPERVLSNKTSSRLGLSRISFPGYTHDELIKIIQLKLENLEQKNIKIKDDSIEYAARKVASVSGDARRALKIVKRAIEIAKETQFSNEEILVQPAQINKAINESTNSPIANYILHLSFVGKLVLVGILSRKRKSGLAENSLGDIIDEIKQILTVNTAKDSEKFLIEDIPILDVIYEDYIVRPKGFLYILNELIESGIILQQNLKSERNSLVKLNVADEEITSAFKNEKSLKFFANLTSL